MPERMYAYAIARHLVDRNPAAAIEARYIATPKPRTVVLSPEEVGVELDEARFAELEAAEQFLLSIADDGQGKRTSAYEYRVIGRGGQGLANMDLTRGKKTAEVRVVAAFPVASSDELVLVTDGGQLIRCPVGGIRIAGRSTRGVRVFDVDEDERVVSVARLADVDDAEEWRTCKAWCARQVLPIDA